MKRLKLLVTAAFIMAVGSAFITKASPKPAFATLYGKAGGDCSEQCLSTGMTACSFSETLYTASNCTGTVYTGNRFIIP